ncbi:MAG: IPT/TIG domain-containing protein, partial [Thermoanaerobaculia bacterium]
MKQWPIFPALLVLLLAFAACEGESPTEPPRPGPPTGGGTTPPETPSIALAVSNATPLVGSTSTITATVTQNGAAVPNGTAVEYSTNLGSFVDSNSNTTVRTTTGGVASAVLTSNAPGTATVTVRVSNATATAQVTFSSEPTEPPPPGTAPTITSVSPSTGRPEGNELVTITGTNFLPPLRVLFGDVPATVLSSTETEIRVSSPPIQLDAAEQAREVQITVVTKAGTADELRVTGGTFRFERQILTPSIALVTPTSGPNDGNTRVTIVGDGFQAPVKVFFGTGGGADGLTDQVEAEVQQVSFGQIVALTPPATGLGAALANQQVSVRVVNVASKTAAVLANAFRYGPEMRITAVSPTQGSAFESTRVTIEGWGFDDEKVAVTVGGIAAQPIFVSGTRIVVQTALPIVTGCSNVSGPISVTNVEDGTSATATGLTFTFLVPQPTIVSVSPNPANTGDTVTVVVANAGGGPARFTVDSTTVLPTSATFDGLEGTYTIVLPSNFQFDTEECTTALGVIGEAFIPTPFDLTFTNAASGCTDTLSNGLIITPPDTSCRVPPAEAEAAPATLAFGDVTVGSTSALSVTVTNSGGQALTVNSITESAGSDPENEFSLAGDGCSGNVVNPNATCTFTVQFAPGNTGAASGSFFVDTTANDITVPAT